MWLVVHNFAYLCTTKVGEFCYIERMNSKCGITYFMNERSDCLYSRAKWNQLTRADNMWFCYGEDGAKIQLFESSS